MTQQRPWQDQRRLRLLDRRLPKKTVRLTSFVIYSMSRKRLESGISPKIVLALSFGANIFGVLAELNRQTESTSLRSTTITFHRGTVTTFGISKRNANRQGLVRMILIQTAKPQTQVPVLFQTLGLQPLYHIKRQLQEYTLTLPQFRAVSKSQILSKCGWVSRTNESTMISGSVTFVFKLTLDMVVDSYG